MRGHSLESLTYIARICVKKSLCFPHLWWNSSNLPVSTLLQYWKTENALLWRQWHNSIGPRSHFCQDDLILPVWIACMGFSGQVSDNKQCFYLTMKKCELFLWAVGKYFSELRSGEAPYQHGSSELLSFSCKLSAKRCESTVTRGYDCMTHLMVVFKFRLFVWL